MKRANDREWNGLREVQIEANINMHAEGSVLVSFGDTQVICTASVENTVPHFLRGRKKGWVTAEYSMLPRATNSRARREAAVGKQGGRTLEIQRLIARSLRCVVDLPRLGERTITVDCDVIQADGGTRTASITGGFVALALALEKCRLSNALTGSVAAISVGIVAGDVLLDLDYSEDSTADTDMNLVMTNGGGLIEVQGTAEQKPFSSSELDQMLVVGRTGIEQLLDIQQQVLKTSDRS